MEPPPPSRRIAALDGWRGIAILLVLFDHAQVTFFNRSRESWTLTGQHGVTLFFVLSGYLITAKLLEAPINLKHFYIRRFFRLMPAAWLYLLVVWCTGLLGRQPLISFSEVASCLFLFRNYKGLHETFFTLHFWSLSIEEQFYIFWPSLLMLLGVRRAKWFAILGAISCAVLRLAYWSYYDQWGPNFRTEMHADALLVGCLLALMAVDQQHRLKTPKIWAAPALAVFLSCIVRFHPLPPFMESVAIGVLIATTIMHPNARFVRALSWRPLAWIGSISYSIYIWQQFFFSARREHAVLFVFILMPMFALVSYYLVERPGIRIGHRITAQRTYAFEVAPTPAQASS